MRAIDPSLFGTSYATFKARFADFDPVYPSKVRAWKNMDEFKTLVHTRVQFIKKRDVLDLPPTTTQTIDVALSSEERRVYYQLAVDFVAGVEGGEITAANALTRLLRLQQATGGRARPDGSEHTERIGTSKQTVLADMLNDLPNGEPVVVFCRFRDDLDAVHAAAQTAGRRSIELSGRRNELGAKWTSETSPGATVAAVQIQAGSEGIDLTFAAYAFFYSPGFSLGQFDQACARLDRHGQTRPVTYYHLAAPATIDTKIIAAIKAKRNLVESIVSAVKEGDFPL
jgi:SNF2 family DNA or RNA helicase